MIVLLVCVTALLMIVAALSVGLLFARQEAGAPDDHPWFVHAPGVADRVTPPGNVQRGFGHALGPRDLRLHRPGG